MEVKAGDIVTLTHCNCPDCSPHGDGLWCKRRLFGKELNVISASGSTIELYYLSVNGDKIYHSILEKLLAPYASEEMTSHNLPSIAKYINLL